MNKKTKKILIVIAVIGLLLFLFRKTIKDLIKPKFPAPNPEDQSQGDSSLPMSFVVTGWLIDDIYYQKNGKFYKLNSFGIEQVSRTTYKNALDDGGEVVETYFGWDLSNLTN